MPFNPAHITAKLGFPVRNLFFSSRPNVTKIPDLVAEVPKDPQQAVVKIVPFLSV
jgi:hypothetical protein